LYAALDLSTGTVIGSLHSRHHALEFLGFLKKIDAEVPSDLDVHLVLDNASTPQDPGGKTLSGNSSPVRSALHPDQLIIAQPRRALVL
jgi:hypothetical protein